MSTLLVLCCDIEVFNPAAQYSMVKPAGVQPFQALMIIGFSLHEFQILLKYAKYKLNAYKTHNIQPCPKMKDYILLSSGNHPI